MTKNVIIFWVGLAVCSVVVAVIQSLLNWLINKRLPSRLEKKLDEMADEKAKQDRINSAVMNGIKVLLRDRISYYYDKYAESDTIPENVLNELTEIYHAYHDLNGNGVGTKMYTELKSKHLVIKNI